MNAQHAEHGDVFQMRGLGRRDVVFLTPQATREMYLDTDRVLSSKLGWSSNIGPMFRNGLMLRDFEDHHLHRRVLQQAFRRTALGGYVTAIHRVIDRHLDDLGPGPVDIYLFMKRLTLDIAADVFVGACLGREAEAVNDSFVAMMAASITRPNGSAGYRVPPRHAGSPAAERDHRRAGLAAARRVGVRGPAVPAQPCADRVR